jgi:hypothetical protein
MERAEVDVDRMVAGLRRRVLDPDERIIQVSPRSGPEALVRTDRRRLDVYRPSWRLLREAWVADAVLVVWQGSALPHAEDQIFGLVFERDDQEYLLSRAEDDLPELGRRLAADADSGGLDPVAFAEVLAQFHTELFLSGHLIDDPALLAERFPQITGAPGLHPVRTQRENGLVTVEFQAYQMSPGDGPMLVLREWTVTASADRPATWTNHEIANLPLR